MAQPGSFQESNAVSHNTHCEKRGFAPKLVRRTWTKSVPPAVAGGLMLVHVQSPTERKAVASSTRQIGAIDRILANF